MTSVIKRIKAIEVCVCGYVVKDDADREQHLHEHYLSYTADVDARYNAMMTSLPNIPRIKRI